LIVFVPEARDYIEEFYSIAQKLHSSEKPWTTKSEQSQTAN
jgi:hypothetical protein